MADEKRSIDLGVFQHISGRPLGSSELLAIVLSAIWLIACIVFFLVLGGADADASGGMRFVFALLATVLPVAVIWLAASAARSARIMREESAQLQTALNTMRQSFVELQQSHVLGVRPGDLTRKLEEISQKQTQTQDALATFVSARPRMETQLPPPPKLVSEAQPELEETGQARLALGTPAEDLAAPLNIEDLIRAINFPESAEDDEGFSALRRALADRNVASLIQAAQDVLTLLSQDGIYMDDLRPDPARPEIWRRFAAGERGRTVAMLGGIRDRSSLALTAGRMRQDTIFRDAAHHFLRRFDEMISSVEPHASDEELTRLGATRTARAFMLLGRVTGTFD